MNHPSRMRPRGFFVFGKGLSIGFPGSDRGMGFCYLFGRGGLLAEFLRLNIVAACPLRP